MQNRVSHLVLTFLLIAVLLTSLIESAVAEDCPSGTCAVRCEDFSTIMEARQPFNYTQEFSDTCVATLETAGIQVRQEGTPADSIIVLTTRKPFPFISEWVGRRGRSPVTWRFERYGF